ncbi:MAG: hypothetical protein ACRDJH_02140, partial [Thermomicrobiales bacterium]
LSSAIDGGRLAEAPLLPGEQSETLVSDSERVFTLRQSSDYSSRQGTAVVARSLDQNGQLTVVGTMALPRPRVPRSTSPLTVGGGALVAHCDNGTTIVLIDGPNVQAPLPDFQPW